MKVETAECFVVGAGASVGVELLVLLDTGVSVVTVIVVGRVSMETFQSVLLSVSLPSVVVVAVVSLLLLIILLSEWVTVVVLTLVGNNSVTESLVV